MVWTCAEEGQRHIGRRMLEMELPGRRQRGRPNRRFMDAVREDMQVVGVSGRYREQIKMESSYSLWQPLKRDKPLGDLLNMSIFSKNLHGFV